MSETATGAEQSAPTTTSEAPPDPKGASASAAAGVSNADPSQAGSGSSGATAAAPASKGPASTPGAPSEAEATESARLRAGFAKLADKEAALLSQQGEYKAAKAAAAKWAELERLAQEDPAALLEKFGGQDPVGYFAKLIEGAEKRYKAPEAPKVEDEVAALRKKLEDRDAAEAKARTDAETAAAMARIDQGKRSVTGMVTAAGDEFELINAEGAHGRVWDAMLEWADLHKGAAIPADLWRHAAVLVEQELTSESDEKLGRLGKTKKFSNRFTTAPEKPATSSESESTGRASSPATLTNNLAAGAPPPAAGKKLSRAESEAETLAFLKSQMAASS